MLLVFLGRVSSLAVIIESSIGLESAKRHAANHAVAGKTRGANAPGIELVSVDGGSEVLVVFLEKGGGERPLEQDHR